MLVKCPSYFKVKLLLDFGYTRLSYNEADRVMEIMGTCSAKERAKIYERVARETEVKRKIEFMRIIEANRGTLLGNL